MAGKESSNSTTPAPLQTKSEEDSTSRQQNVSSGNPHTQRDGPSPSQSPRSSIHKEEHEGPHRASSTKSQVSFSGDILSIPGSMSASQFMSYRQRSSIGFLLPANFFQSRQDIRIWGEEDLTDPSIQPYDPHSPSLPRPFHVSLPGYPSRLCRYAIARTTKEERDPFLGPEITIFPPTWIPKWTPDPNFKAQRYGYNWEDSDAFRMDRLPYVNAEFDPVSAEVTHMYSQCYPYTAYPYGVPRVA